MGRIGELYQSADWKSEKHVPVIECSDQVKKDEIFEVRVTLGKEVARPSTKEHQIRWIQLFFRGDGDKFPYQVGHFEFTPHGEAVDGPNKGPVYTHHSVSASLKVSKSGVLYATALCNIHGLWESAKEIELK